MDHTFREATYADANEIILLVNEAYEVHEGNFKKDPRLDKNMISKYYLDPQVFSLLFFLVFSSYAKKQTRSMTIFVGEELLGDEKNISGCIALHVDEVEHLAKFGLLATKVGSNKKGLAGEVYFHSR